MTYLKCEVCLLFDVFENFRKTCIEYYDLDPSHYLTAPSLAWDAMLLNNKVKLEMLHYLDMLNMKEKIKRGGLRCVGSTLYVKADNQHLPDYDPNQPSNYIIYQDANNLYGCSMSEYLPYKDLEWDNLMKLEYILEAPDDHRTGYISEEDLHFPVELHDKLKELPPFPETLTPDIEWLTPYQREIEQARG